MSFPIPLPSLEEQRRIAAILDRAEALRAKRRDVLAHLDSLTQAIFHDMFGDPDAASETVAFGDIAGLTSGRNLVSQDPTIQSPFRVLKISSVTSGNFAPAESKPLPLDYVPPEHHLVQTGDLIMSRANTADLVGAVAYVSEAPPNLALPDKLWRFAWNSKADPIFYHALLSSPAIRRRISALASGTGGSMKNVSKTKLQAMRLPRVPLREQRLFSRRAASLTKHRGVLTRGQEARVSPIAWWHS